MTEKVYFDALKVQFLLVMFVDTEGEVQYFCIFEFGLVKKVANRFFFHVKLKLFNTIC